MLGVCPGRGMFYSLQRVQGGRASDCSHGHDWIGAWRRLPSGVYETTTAFSSSDLYLSGSGFNHRTKWKTLTKHKDTVGMGGEFWGLAPFLTTPLSPTLMRLINRML